MWSELAASVQGGNPYVLIMLALAFVATVILFERIIMLQYVYHIDFKKFLLNLKKMIAAEDLPRAMNLCKSASKTSLPYITLRALEAAETDPTKIKGTIEEETIDFLPKIERRIGALPAIATIVLLVGVLGTIESLWGAFRSVDVLDSVRKEAALSLGIAGSLNPTAFGLLTCVLLFAGHQMIRGMAISLTEKVHYGVAAISNLLVPAETVVAATAAPSAAPAAQTLASEPPPETASEQTQNQGVTTDESVETAAIEDIKDEEEII